MFTFKQFFTEAKDPAPGILHLEHPSDRVFDGKDAAEHAHKTLVDVAAGQAPLTRKIDDRVSFQAIRTEDGRVGVKYKGPGSHYNFSQKDIETQHGHKPHLVSTLGPVLKHIGKVLPKTPGEYQGGFLSTPETRTVSGGKINHKPNTISYSVPEKTPEGQKLKASKVSMVVHTELKGPNKEAHPILSMGQFAQHPDVHQMSHIVDDKEKALDPKNESTAKINEHLSKARQLLSNHDYAHLEGHSDMLRTYINQTVRNGSTPNVSEYAKHVAAHHEREIGKVKMQKTKQEKMARAAADAEHISKNKSAFAKTFQIHGHLQAATNLISRQLGAQAHGGYDHTIDDKPTHPEGFVANGLKIVDRQGFSAANLLKGDKFKQQKQAV